ncbi:NADP oxidoreductase [Streptococcus oralis]|nr:NADP oxidoreductase [Streptococcus oralis]MCY7074642.1 NADP oxidoreductase [Streptococcus oralis]
MSVYSGRVEVISTNTLNTVKTTTETTALVLMTLQEKMLLTSKI